MVRDRSRSEFRPEDPVDIVIMARDPLALATKEVASLKPVPDTVEDDYHVPEGPLCDHGRHVFGTQRELGHFVRNIGNNGQTLMRIES